jgi:hypothetical protein
MSDDTTQTTESSVEQQAAPAPSLQLSDLVLALQTIQATAQRGAIRADEMSTIGGLHDRLFAFLEAQGAITRQAPAAPESQGAQDA